MSAAEGTPARQDQMSIEKCIKNAVKKSEETANVAYSRYHEAERSRRLLQKLLELIPVWEKLSRRYAFRFPTTEIEDEGLTDIVASNFAPPIDPEVLDSCDKKRLTVAYEHFSLMLQLLKDALLRPPIRIRGFSVNPVGGTLTDREGEKCLGDCYPVLKLIFSFLDKKARMSSVAVTLGLSPTVAGVPPESAIVYAKMAIPIAFIRCLLPGHLCMLVHRNDNNKRFFARSGCVVIAPATAMRNPLGEAPAAIDDLRAETGAIRRFVKDKLAIVFWWDLQLVQNNAAVLANSEVRPLPNGKLMVKVGDIRYTLAKSPTKDKRNRAKKNGAAFGGIDGDAYFALKTPTPVSPSTRLPLSDAPTGISFWKHGAPRGDPSDCFGGFRRDRMGRKFLTVFTQFGPIDAWISRGTQIPGEGSLITTWWPLVSGFVWRHDTRIWLLVYGTTSFSNPAHRSQPVPVGLSGSLVPWEPWYIFEPIDVSDRWQAYMRAPSSETFRGLGYSIDVPRTPSFDGDAKLLFLPGRPDNGHNAPTYIVRFLARMHAEGNNVFSLKGDPRLVPDAVDYGVVSTLADGRELRLASSPYNGRLFLRTSEEERPIPSTQKRQRFD